MPSERSAGGRLRAAYRRLLEGGRRLREGYGWRDVAPLLLPVLFAPWLWVAARNFAGAAMWSDVNMFNYAGWCLRKGERLYDTIAVPDGPFVIAIHALVTLIAGTGDQALRRLDLVVNALAGLVMGVVLAPASQGGRLLPRVVWGLVGLAIWMAHVAQTDFGSSMQREEYYVALGSIAMCLAYASREYSARVARWMLGGAGLLSGLLVFGKQTGVVYVAFVVLVILCLPANPQQTRRRRLIWAGVGAGVAAVSMLGLVAFAGSLRGFFTWYVEFPVVVYRYFNPGKSLAEILTMGERTGFMAGAAVALLGGVSAVALRVMPARALAFAIAPAIHFGLAVAQLKGWHHHYLPVRASTYVFFLVALTWAWAQPKVSPEHELRALVAAALLLLVGARIMEGLLVAPWMREAERCLDEPGVVEGHAGADYLRDHTRPDDRVLYYGNNPLVLFAAERRPALPTETVLMLNFAIARDNKSAAGPDAAARERMDRLERRVQDDACRHIVSSAPAAMVFTDHADGGSPDGAGDVAAACPALRSLLERDYRLATTLHRLRIYLRKDR